MVDELQGIPVEAFIERAKELECLYLVDDALTNNSIPEILMEISSILPQGFCNPQACVVNIVLDDQTYTAKPEIAIHREIRSPIIVRDEVRGYLQAAYPYNEVDEDKNVFLVQEEKLLNTVAKKISQMIERKSIQETSESRSNWEAIVKLLQITDHEMLLYVCEKLLALLAKDNQDSVRDIYQEMNWTKYEYQGEINFPLEKMPAVDVLRLSESVFSVAKTYLKDSQIFHYINLWIYQGKTYDLIKLVDKADADVKDVLKALSKYLKTVKSNAIYNKATQRWLIVELARRFLTDNPKLIENARKYALVEDFCELLKTFICSPKSTGKIGGKAAGLFLAKQIIKNYRADNPEFANIKVPKTWYIASDELVKLIHDNGLDELNEHKYRDLLEIRIIYPKVIQTLKNARLSPYVMNELYQILEYSENKALIIRSSSLLEDQLGSSFSGKYKSLFLTNKGTRAERLKSLVDGILEVYASMFSPDSIQYRIEHNLLDYTDQMGVMIQEVVGCRIGPYYAPIFSGVAFSNNEFRWSPRIKREDGLLRMVVGLGTRAVDRVGDDFPVLISPGQPNIRVNQVPQEMHKYSPQKMDVLDIENNRFLTISIAQYIKDYGNDIPRLNYIASVLKDDFITELNKFATDFQRDNIIITFDELIEKTPIVAQLHSVMSLLQEKLGYPVDIEFASDGENIYLLQCRPQSTTQGNVPVAIPTNIAVQNMIFTANRYVSNGRVTGIKTVVYVDPEEYGKLENHQDLVNVGSAIGELNRILPRRSFILMGPGRWGSRGDIKLGVRVTYSDINNSSMLIEVAKKESKYQPELSFGTHFFQDLVEENIKYLPLYPEDNEVLFSNYFFTRSTNALVNILPAYAYLEHVIKVINVAESYHGQELFVLMNADLEKAVAYLDYPAKPDANSNANLIEIEDKTDPKDNQGWKWRHYMAEQISAKMDLKAFGVKGIYLFGSTNYGTARLNSDIDLIIHFEGTPEQRQTLDLWLNGWSMALSEINYLRTGYRTDGLLDIHYVTDQDIKNQTLFASKINSIYDPAHLLRLRED